MLQLLPISQSLHHVPPKRQCFQAPAFPQLRDAPRSDRSGGGSCSSSEDDSPLGSTQATARPVLQRQPPAAASTQSRRANAARACHHPHVSFISGNSAEGCRHVKVCGWDFFFPPLFFLLPESLQACSGGYCSLGCTRAVPQRGRAGARHNPHPHSSPVGDGCLLEASICTTYCIFP